MQKSRYRIKTTCSKIFEKMKDNDGFQIWLPESVKSRETEIGVSCLVWEIGRDRREVEEVQSPCDVKHITTPSFPNDGNK